MVAAMRCVCLRRSPFAPDHPRSTRDGNITTGTGDVGPRCQSLPALSKRLPARAASTRGTIRSCSSRNSRRSSPSTRADRRCVPGARTPKTCTVSDWKYWSEVQGRLWWFVHAAGFIGQSVGGPTGASVRGEVQVLAAVVVFEESDVGAVRASGECVAAGSRCGQRLVGDPGMGVGCGHQGVVFMLRAPVSPTEAALIPGDPCPGRFPRESA